MSDKDFWDIEASEMPEQVSEIAKRQESSEHVEVAMSEGGEVTSAHIARKRQRKLIDNPYVPSKWLKYACERPVSDRWYHIKNTGKPAWAVDALVRLRDQGVCQVCGDQYGRDGVVVRCKPRAAGGQFDELNCVAVCKECARVWNHNRDFYTSGDDDLDYKKQVLYVMKRRAVGRKDALPLSVEGLAKYRELLEKVEQVKARKRHGLYEDKTVEGVARLIEQAVSKDDNDVLGNLSNDPALEFLRTLHKRSKASDSVASDNEEKQSNETVHTKESDK